MNENSESTEKILDAVLASMGEAVIVVDPNKRTIVHCNAAAERLFGYDRQELIGMKTRDLHVDQEHYERFGRKGEPVLEKGEVFETEYRMKRKDGTIIDTHNTVSPIREELGWEAGVVSIIRDITEQKEGERNLKNERRRLREAQQIGRLGDWYYEVDTGRIYWSPMMYEIYERDPELGPPRYEDLQSYYREESDYHDQMVQRAIDEKQPYSYDMKIYTDGGNERYIHVEGKPQENEEGEVIKLYGIVQDITELREAQDQMQLELSKFSQLFSHSPDAIAITDADGRIMDVNMAFEELFGYMFHEVKGRNIYQLLTRNKKQREEARRNAERLRKKESYRDEVVRYTKNDEKVYVSTGEAAVEIEGRFILFFTYIPM